MIEYIGSEYTSDNLENFYNCAIDVLWIIFQKRLKLLETKDCTLQ